MKIHIDQKAVKRNGIIGKILRWTSLGCMLIGLFAVFSQEVAENPRLFSVFFTIMLIGIILSSVSAYFTTRFGKSPRPDELIDKAFKGLDDRYHIFHYKSSIPHLLISPSGVWTITPTFVDGEIHFDKNNNKWVHKKNSIINRFLSKEYFPNPSNDLKSHNKDFQKALNASSINSNIELNSLIILMNRNASLNGDNEIGNILILPFDKVKDKYRKLAKGNEKQPEINETLVEIYS